MRTAWRKWKFCLIVAITLMNKVHFIIFASFTLSESILFEHPVSWQWPAVVGINLRHIHFCEKQNPSDPCVIINNRQIHFFQLVISS